MAGGVHVLPVPGTLLSPAVRVVLGLGGLVLASLLLRTDVLGSGYWTDESISIGIASQPLLDIPATLRLDGSPPLYYLLLHGWMGLFGTDEAATRGLSLACSLTAVPAAWAATRAATPDGRAPWLAAGAAAAMPFLTAYGQETRMYALVVVLSLAATGCFAAMLRTGATRHALGLAASATALLYTHNWSAFLLLALALAWVWEWHRGRAAARPGLLAAGLTLVAFAPWLPSLAFQAAHTGAPWATVPPPFQLLAGPIVLGGMVGGPVLIVAVAAALVQGRRAAGRTAAAPGARAGMLVAVGLAATALAWTFNQLEPAWASRYLAVTAGPLLVGAALALHRVAWLPVLVAVVGVAWVAWTPQAERSNARALATALTPQLDRGDAVIAAGPQHTPVLAAYLPDGLRWSTTAGPVADPTVVDWRDLTDRMRATRPRGLAAAAVAGLGPSGRVVVVTPFEHARTDAPLRVLTRARSAQLTELLDRDPRLIRVPSPPTSLLDQRSSLRASVWQRVEPGR